MTSTSRFGDTTQHRPTSNGDAEHGPFRFTVPNFPPLSCVSGILTVSMIYDDSFTLAYYNAAIRTLYGTIIKHFDQLLNNFLTRT